jgi:hypothetical protein
MTTSVAGMIARVDRSAVISVSLVAPAGGETGPVASFYECADVWVRSERLTSAVQSYARGRRADAECDGDLGRGEAFPGGQAEQLTIARLEAPDGGADDVGRRIVGGRIVDGSAPVVLPGRW